MSHLPDHPDFDRVDDVTWYAYRVKTKHEESGESREQVWLGYNANHALERADRSNLFVPVPDEVTATWLDPEEYLYKLKDGE